MGGLLRRWGWSDRGRSEGAAFFDRLGGTNVVTTFQDAMIARSFAAIGRSVAVRVRFIGGWVCGFNVRNWLNERARCSKQHTFEGLNLRFEALKLLQS